MTTRKAAGRVSFVILIGVVVVAVCAYKWYGGPAFEAVRKAMEPNHVSESNMTLNVTRDAITRYRIETGHYPGYSASGEALAVTGKQPSDLFAIMSSREGTRGPWLQAVPQNPYDKSSAVNGAAGWIYGLRAGGDMVVFNMNLAAVPSDQRSSINNQGDILPAVAR